jgi:hypothetical protein
MVVGLDDCSDALWMIGCWMVVGWIEVVRSSGVRIIITIKLPGLDFI